MKRFRKQTMNNLAPIVLFVYNRPWHTQQTVEALQKNNLADESDLFIYSDGPKKEDDKSTVKEVRKFIKTIKGFKKVVIFEHEKNSGLANSIINGVTNIVNQYGKIIVLEDDLVSSPYFLKYMNDALEFYNEENKVISIHGYIYPIKQTLSETFFIRGADCWGWATWKRGWELFETDAKKLLNELRSKRLIDEFNFNNSYDYFGMLKNLIKNRNSSWAVQWYASAFLKDKLTLYPGKTLIKNIGTDFSGTHCDATDVFDVELEFAPVRVNKIPIQEDKNDRKKIENFFLSLRTPVYRRFLNKITNKKLFINLIWTKH